jgi:hypothetical protein
MKMIDIKTRSPDLMRHVEADNNVALSEADGKPGGFYINLF